MAWAPSCASEGTHGEPPQKCILKAFLYQIASTISSSLFFLSQNSSVIETLPTRLQSTQVSEPWVQECDSQTVHMASEPHGQARRGDGTPAGCELASGLCRGHPETGTRQ